MVGQGGNGTVWACSDLQSGAIVAVKIVPTSRVSRWEQSESGLIPQEVSMLRLLKDKANHCISILDYFTEGNDECIVQYYPTSFFPTNQETSRDLFDFIERQEYIPECIAKLIFQQLCDGLQSMHDLGITHGDIKDEVFIANMEYFNR